VQAAAATLATLFIIFDLLASGTAVLRLQSAVACSRRRRRRLSRASLLRRCRLAPCDRFVRNNRRIAQPAEFQHLMAAVT
jgi:hypothetical protein